jgi:hypothetical protein
MVTALFLLILSGAPGRVVWSTGDTLRSGDDRTFTAKGTVKGQSYVFRASGQCKWEPKVIRTRRRVIRRDRPDRIFGIDFRVEFGNQEKRFLEVGEAETLETELEFVADSDDMKLRVFDAFKLPDKVHCTIHGIQIVSAR